MVKIQRNDDKFFLIIDDGEPIELEVKQPSGWDLTVFLPENPTGRKLLNVAALNKRFDKAGVDELELTDKAQRVSNGTREPAIPNKRLIEYLKDYHGTDTDGNEVDGNALYDEYMTIIEEARAAKAAAVKAPKTDLEKAKEKLAKAQAALDALIAEASGETVGTVEADNNKSTKKNKKEAN